MCVPLRSVLEFRLAASFSYARGKRWASQVQRQPTIAATLAATLGSGKSRPHLNPPLEKRGGRTAQAVAWRLKCSGIVRSGAMRTNTHRYSHLLG